MKIKEEKVVDLIYKVSLVGHRQGAHGAIKLKPGITNESLRLATGILGGIRMRAVPMHRWHHENADTVLDPHAPSILGRGRVFRSITKISEQFALTHPEYTRKVGAESVYTSPRFYEKTPLFIGAVVASHMLVGKKLGLPTGAGVVSAGMHLSLIYAQNAMFTADVHSDKNETPVEIRKFPYGNIMNIIFGSENGHQAHHDQPGNPQMSDYDAVYAGALALRKIGFAEMPYLDASATPS